MPTLGMFNDGGLTIPAQNSRDAIKRVRQSRQLDRRALNRDDRQCDLRWLAG